MNQKILRIMALVVVVIAALVAVALRAKSPSHTLVIRAYFTDARGLRSGAKVRLAGVDIGSVKSVRARPEIKETPAEVVMVLSPGYRLDVPNDSTASLSTAGLLGETYVAIDASHVSGPPIMANGVLRTVPTSELSTQDILKKVDEAVARKFDCGSKVESDSEAAKKHSNAAQHQ